MNKTTITSLIVVLATLVSLSWYVVLFHYPIPYFDGWDMVPLLRLSYENELSIGSILAPHGASHLHASGYALSLVLARLSEFSQLTEVLTGVLITVVSFIVGLGIVRSVAEKCELQVRIPELAALTAIFLFSIDQAANFLWSWQLAVHLNTLSVLLTTYALSRDRLTIFWLMFAMFGTTIAIYSFTTGLALLPIGYLMIILRPPARHPVVPLVLWTLFSVGVSLQVIPEIHASRSQHEGAIDILAMPISELGVYVLKFLSGGLVRFEKDIAVETTLLAILIGILCLWFLWRRHQIGLYKLAPLLGLASYAIGAAILTAIGRIHFGTDQAFVFRYITLSNYFWLSLTLFLFIWRCKEQLKPSWARSVTTLTVVLSVIFVFKMYNQFEVGKNRAREGLQVAKAAFQLCETYPAYSDEVLTSISAPHQEVRPLITYLHDKRLSYFRHCTLEIEDNTEI